MNFERIVHNVLMAIIILGFIISLLGFISYNGLGDLFEYKKLEKSEISIEISNHKGNNIIKYAYSVNGKNYKYKTDINNDSSEAEIYYNVTLPFLNYVDTIENMQSLIKFIMKFFIFSFFFSLALYFFHKKYR